MEISEYANIFSQEDCNFYYLANHKIVLDLAREKLNSKAKILDAGCGTGGLAQKLSKFGSAWAVDINPMAIKFARQRGVRVKQASINKLPFGDNFFDLVTSVDVIYHTQVDEKKAVKEFLRVLKPGGMLVIRVPANNWLMRSSDKHVHTRERYSKRKLEKLLEGCGFGIKKLSYINMLLLPLSILTAFWEKIFKPKNDSSPLVALPNSLNSAVAQLLIFEGFFLKFANLPFGLGLIAVCKKP